MPVAVVGAEEIYPMIRQWYADDKSQTVLADIWGGIEARAKAA